MEFIQFHPTCLYHPYAKSFLISEAVRGEGGLLKLPAEAGAAAGTRFMPAHDERAELAPRDVVARAIDFEMKKRGLDHVDLDISHQSTGILKRTFPHHLCRAAWNSASTSRKQPIPVVPAVHFTCGGVVTDLVGPHRFTGPVCGRRKRRTPACTAPTGWPATRCWNAWSSAAPPPSTSNSSRNKKPIALPAWDESRVTDADEEVVIAHNWDELRRFMWNYVGIVRTTKRLERAQHRIGLLKEEIDEYYANFRITRDLLELRNLVDVASLIVNSALTRHESRGLHYSLDYPETLAEGAADGIGARPETLSADRIRQAVMGYPATAMSSSHSLGRNSLWPEYIE